MSVNPNKKLDLPKISLKRLGENNEEYLESLRKICREVGTFYLIDHGVDASLCKEIQRLTRKFFSLTQEQKEEISMLNSPQFRGYSSEGGEYTDGGRDYREQIDWGIDKEPTRWDINSPLWERLEGQNQYPSALPELKECFNAWQEQVSIATLAVLRALASALELDSDAFDRLYGHNSYAHSKLIRYPATFEGKTQGVGSHKDGGLITFVMQEEQGGLQGLIDGVWQDVDPLENSFVVNIGEFLEMATNGYLKATVHRVNLSEQERFSIAYFLGVQLDKNVPIFNLKPKYAKDARGVDTDPKNPLLRDVAHNYFKRMIRSHPDVARKYHSDLIERFRFR